MSQSANVLVLYDPYCLFTLTVREHLNAFGVFMDANVHYCAAVDHAELMIDLSSYDAIIIHYSVRVALGWHISESINAALAQYTGSKILFVQDEYDNTDTTHKFIQEQNIALVFTCVPKPYVAKVYPPEKFPETRFITNLTGYVPASIPVTTQNWDSLESRKLMVAYRGRELPAIYGELGREKLIIAQKVRHYCKINNIDSDIEWDDSKRIYDKDWYSFLQSARASLGTESGSNVFDLTGELHRNVSAYIEDNPNAEYADIYPKFIQSHDNYIKMNQISPRFFECISLGTILILFEGKYSNVIKPDKHFIALKKDLSNIDKVFEKLSDLEYCHAMRLQAHKDIIQSGHYSYLQFMKMVCRNISPLLSKRQTLRVKKELALEDVFGLCSRPATYRIHGYATQRPIDVKDYTLSPAPPNMSPDIIHLGPVMANQPPNYPKVISILAPFFPHRFKRFIKKVLYGYIEPKATSSVQDD